MIPYKITSNNLFVDLLALHDRNPLYISDTELQELSKSSFYYMWAIMQNSHTSLVPKTASIENFDDYVRVGLELSSCNVFSINAHKFLFL